MASSDTLMHEVHLQPPVDGIMVAPMHRAYVLCISLVCSNRDCEPRSFSGPQGETGTDDCMRALETLFSVLFSMCRLMVSLVRLVMDACVRVSAHLKDYVFRAKGIFCKTFRELCW